MLNIIRNKSVKAAQALAVKAATINQESAAKALTVTLCAVSLAVLAYDPANAATLESVENAATSVDNFIGGTFAKTVAGIALAGTGFAALFNRLSWFWFGAVILGVAIIFGRKQIIEIFAGNQPRRCNCARQ